MKFGEKDYAHIRFDPRYRSHVDDFSLRFWTPKPNGLLWKTYDDRSGQYMRVYLDNGIAKLETNVGGGTRVQFIYNVLVYSHCI